MYLSAVQFSWIAECDIYREAPNSIKFLFGCYHFEIVQLHPVLPARIGHEGWGARTSEELSLGSFVCEYAGAMAMRPYQHPSCEDQHPSCEDQTTWWQLKYSIFYMFNYRSFCAKMIQFDWLICFYLLGGSTTNKTSPFVASRSPTSHARWGAPRCWSWEFRFRAWCVAWLMGTDDGSNEPEKQMDLLQKNAGCEKKKMFTQIVKTKPQSRHLDLSHAIVSSNYWRCEMMCSCLDGQASAWSI